MALLDNAVLVPNTGNYFTAPVGTEYPTSLTDPESEWVNIGHSSMEDILGISSEGGERTILGTLQNKQLRTTTSPRSETFTINLQQFDAESLKLYYGSNSVDVDGGKLIGVPTNPAPTERAFLAVLTDGVEHFAIYAPKASIFRGEDLDITDTESLASLPLAITPLGHGSNPWPYAVTPIGETVVDPGEG